MEFGKVSFGNLVGSAHVVSITFPENHSFKNSLPDRKGLSSNHPFLGAFAASFRGG